MDESGKTRFAQAQRGTQRAAQRALLRARRRGQDLGKRRQSSGNGFVVMNRPGGLGLDEWIGVRQKRGDDARLRASPAAPSASPAARS